MNSLNLYEAIVDSKIFETAQSQIDNLNKMSDKLVTEVTVPEPAELQEIKQKAAQEIDKKKADVEKQLTDIKKDEQFIQEIP